MTPKEFAKQHPLAKTAHTDELYQEEWYQIMESYASERVREACKAQREICADSATASMEVVDSVDGKDIRPMVNKKSIRNAPLLTK